ncbi:MAG: pyridoxal-phosphate dependent enzyme [bacterium]
MLYDNVLQAVGNTPLVRLSRIAQGVKPLLAAKLEFTNPGGSVKDRIALGMVEDAETKGLLKPGGTIIEGTSGNTGMGLAMVASVKGYRCIFTMPDKMSREKIDALRGMGAEVVITPTAVAHDDPRSYHEVARRLNREIPNSFFPNQYDNPCNIEAHRQTTGPEIWDQTGGRATHVVIGIGTGGTITGVGRYLKEQNPAIRMVGVDPEGSIFEGMFRGGKAPPTWPYKVEGVGQDVMPANVDFSVVDEVVSVGDKEAFNATRNLARLEGIFAGGSSGMALAAALRVADGCAETDYLVVLLPDSGSRYLSKIYNDAWMKENQYLDAPVFLDTSQILAEKGERSELVSVSSDATIGEAIELMRTHAISQLPVISDGQILGALDENSLLSLLLSNAEAWHHNVLEFMQEPFPVVSEDTPVDDLLAMLGQQGAAVLISRRDGGLSIVTKSDLLFTLLRAEKEVKPNKPATGAPR